MPSSSSQQLASLLHRQSLILNAIGDGVYGLDAQGRLTFANAAAQTMMGWSEAELLDKSIHHLHHHSHADGSPYPLDQCPIFKAAHDGQSYHISQEVFWRKDGSCFPVEYSATPIFENDQLVGAVAVFRDVSQRMTHEQQLKTSLEQIERLKAEAEQENNRLRAQVAGQQPEQPMLGEAPAMQLLRQQIDQVSPTDASVLITGENGVGKELVAQAIHQQSSRATGPLIKVNCGAIAPTLVESELFGHEKGAFTGATVQRKGRFELADGGTLFLDEVAELPMDAQVKLLRILQEREMERVGGSRTLQLDVRIIAATNRDLQKMVGLGLFRMDLFYRLKVFPIQVPPLRQRKQDIPLLASALVQQLAQKLGRRINGVSQKSIQRLIAHDWPGNIREMQNVLEHAAIISRGEVLDIPELVSPELSGVSQPNKMPLMTAEDAERENIRRVLAHTQGVIAGKQGAAAILDLPPSTLRSRMKRLAIDQEVAIYR
ncbi:sigma-54 interaction domain-containing protein [Pelagibaculum spongiae]|uniref:Fis family transcriptional regulator n=1 Tax=Pelagibaculum spongiae TaxID=2080658 RepID=A0A2V1GZ82_9GAMM|nr:sigma 54-interacting transcriptional regulator [Pelagibaculum spongiae]PVZ70697.1 Fis family transcriptional regulator [Pelagibaculum spongiae]